MQILGLNPDTTASAKAQLNRLYDASVGSYLSKLKAKANKIAETINNFSTALNQGIYLVFIFSRFMVIILLDTSKIFIRNI